MLTPLIAIFRAMIPTRPGLITETTLRGGSSQDSRNRYRNAREIKADAGALPERAVNSFGVAAFQCSEAIELGQTMPTGRGNWSNFWRRHLQRNRSGFEELTQPHVDALWRVAHRMTGDRDAADDLTQETCLRAYRAFDSFEQGTNYKAWIFRILTNLCSDHLRRRARAPFRPLGPETEPPEEIAPIHEAPDQQLMRKDFRQDLSEAIQSLSPELRLVMSLSLLKELSYEEIATIAECPIGTVRSRISRGKTALRKALAGHLPEHSMQSSATTLKLAHAARPARSLQIVEKP